MRGNAMIYASAAEWRAAQRKRVLVFGMSGLGKTHLANMLRGAGGWFHYSVDYRIGTRYMGELIADNFKREAMKVPLLRELLMTDSVYISSNITFDNLAPLSTYLGKPGDPARGGLPFDEYMTVRTSTARPRWHRCWIRRGSSTGRRILWLSELHLRLRRVDLRGGGCRRTRRSGDDGPVRGHADGLDQGVRRAYGGTGPPL